MNRLLLLAQASVLILAGFSTLRAEEAKGPNVLLLCIDDLRPELGCYGVDYIHSPHIDRLASQGHLFERHYVQAPTCGASRYALLTGRYNGPSNAALFQRAERLASGEEVPPSLPAWFRTHGYTTVSVGKVSHHPGGRGGPNWDDDAQPEMPHSWDRHLCPTGPWQHPRGVMHGLAHGEIRGDAKEMDVYQSAAGEDGIYPDGRIVATAVDQLDELSRDSAKPFLLAVGIIRPHLPFGAPAKYMQPYQEATLPAIPHPTKPEGKTTWHRSGEFMKYNRWGRNPNEDAEFAEAVRKHYAACVTYADALVGELLQRLEDLSLADDTIVVLWGDHGWHLGEHAIWGKHALFEESLHSPLIIRAPATTQGGSRSRSIVESIDLFPTLCELAGLPRPSFVDGQSLKPQLEGEAVEPEAGAAVSYFRQGESLRTHRYRLVSHHDGHVELYDHESEAGETRNIAARNAPLVAELKRRLAARRSGG